MTAAFLWVADHPNASGWWHWKRTYSNGRIVTGCERSRDAAIKALNADHSWIWRDAPKFEPVPVLGVLPK